jgi:peptidoglycan/xylan/chitin deacetylase (PgdA/CDA1 family)
MTDRRRSAVLAGLLCLAMVACVPAPAGRTEPPLTASPSTAASTPLPSPTGPTPVPSFVRPTPLPSPTFFVYLVRSGDTLSSIARRFSTTAFSLAVWNRSTHPSLDPDSEGYDPNRIQVGWELRLIPGEVVDEEELLQPTPSPGPSASTGAATSSPPGTAASSASPPPVARAATVVRHGPRATRTVALTFDMGGRLDPALDILTWLADRDVDATIFPTGKTGTQTAQGLAALEFIADHRERFDVGNHSWSHPDFRDLDAAAMRSQVEMTDAAILAAVNLDTKPWFRPPFGGLDDQVPAVVGAAGWAYVVMWDIDTIDWRPESDGGPSAEAIVDKVLDRVEGGSIVLMHLGGYRTLEALPGILHGLAERGLRPVTLGEMFGEG